MLHPICRLPRRLWKKSHPLPQRQSLPRRGLAERGFVLMAPVSTHHFPTQMKRLLPRRGNKFFIPRRQFPKRTFSPVPPPRTPRPPCEAVFIADRGLRIGPRTKAQRRKGFFIRKAGKPPPRPPGKNFPPPLLLRFFASSRLKKPRPPPRDLGFCESFGNRH